jgi:hypothetical protein
MCRFFAVNIFWNHRIRQLDYYSESILDTIIPLHVGYTGENCSSVSSEAFPDPPCLHHPLSSMTSQLHDHRIKAAP